MLKRALLVLGTVVAMGAPAGAADIDIGVLADVVLAADEDLIPLSQMRTGDSYTDFLHTRLFFDAGDERTAVFAQLVLSDTARDPVRIFAAYLQHQLLEDRELYVQAGRIPNTQGIWGPQGYADKNALVAAPLAYYWQSGLPVTGVPASIDDLVGRADGRTSYGALAMYDNCWNDGLSLLGARGRFSWHLAATRGAPGNPVAGASQNDDIALNAKLAFAPAPEVTATLSWGRGAYLNRSAGDDLATGQSINDYHQDLWVGSLELSRGYVRVQGEFFFTRFETPLRDDGLSMWSAWGEAVWKFAAGWYAAARYDALRFEEVETSSGARAWDTDLDRMEAGVGYHFSRHFLLKGVVQTTDLGGGFRGDTTLPMLQAVARF